jgi:hypothetical protein
MRLHEFITPRELSAVETIAERVWSKLGIDIEFTKHFLDRVNDERNGQEITIQELAALFIKEYQQHGNEIAKLPPGAEVLLTDLLSNINTPVHVKKDMKGDKKMVAATVMRTKDFKTSTKRYKVR